MKKAKKINKKKKQRTVRVGDTVLWWPSISSDWQKAVLKGIEIQCNWKKRGRSVKEASWDEVQEPGNCVVRLDNGRRFYAERIIFSRSGSIKTKVQIITSDLLGKTFWPRDKRYALAYRGNSLSLPGWYITGFKSKAERETCIKEVTRGIEVVERRVSKPLVIEGRQAFLTSWSKAEAV